VLATNYQAFKMKKIFLLFFLVAVNTTCNAQHDTTSSSAAPLEAAKNTDPKKIHWMSLEEAYIAVQKEPRKIVIDVFTGWCGWCKVMDQKTFSEAKVAEYVNKNFYAVKLDAEQKEDITLGSQKYSFVVQGQGGYHQAAAGLMGGKMSYPTIVYLDEKFNLIQAVPGYQDAKQFHQIITFFGDNFYKKEDWNKYSQETYQKQFGNQNNLASGTKQ
jgi:thioredoxin-related protein